MMHKLCELCGAKAAVYCPSDSAFLCCTCDSNVHSANFLVARHLRTIISSNSNSFPPHHTPFLSAYCCSDCVSTTMTSSRTTSLPQKKKSDSRRSTIMDWKKAEGVLVHWCGKLGLSGSDDRSVRLGRSVAALCVGLGWDQMSDLPFRVTLVAALWFGLDRSLRTCHVLKRLEYISSVQAKLILVAESKLERALRSRQRNNTELQEGWAESECST